MISCSHFLGFLCVDAYSAATRTPAVGCQCSLSYHDVGVDCALTWFICTGPCALYMISSGIESAFCQTGTDCY